MGTEEVKVLLEVALAFHKEESVVAVVQEEQQQVAGLVLQERQVVRGRRDPPVVGAPP